MLRTSFASFRPVTFAAAAETGSDKADEKAIDKVVYITADKSLKAVVTYTMNAADATLRLIGAMVTHMIVRSYHPVAKERSNHKDTRAEIMSVIKEHAAMRRGFDFNRAWNYRLIGAAERMARSLVTDYDKKGVQDGSPLSKVLRAKDVDKAVQIVFDFMVAKTGGATSFAALEKALNPVTKTGQRTSAGGSQKGKGKGKGGAGNAGNRTGGNSVKPETVGKVLAGDKGQAIINAIEAKSPVARAQKLSDKIAGAQVDHFTMAKRFIAMIDKPDQLLKLADMATERAKELHAKASDKAEPAAAGKPDKAVAAQG